MGYTVSPVAVDLDEVRAAVGSKDERLLAELTAELVDDLERIDDVLCEYSEDEDGSPITPLTAAEVLRHLVMSEPHRRGVGFAYGQCFAALCAHFGDALGNDRWSGIPPTRFGAVQAALERVGVGAKRFAVDRLVYRGPPVKLPYIDNYPSIGYLTRAEVAEARAVLAVADLSKATDRSAAAAIEQLRDWFAACAHANRDLVCTYA